MTYVVTHTRQRSLRTTKRIKARYKEPITETPDARRSRSTGNEPGNIPEKKAKMII